MFVKMPLYILDRPIQEPFIRMCSAQTNVLRIQQIVNLIMKDQNVSTQEDDQQRKTSNQPDPGIQSEDSFQTQCGKYHQYVLYKTQRLKIKRQTQAILSAIAFDIAIISPHPHGNMDVIVIIEKIINPPVDLDMSVEFMGMRSKQVNQSNR